MPWPRKPRKEPSDAEVREILTQAMADVGDPALVYAFHKTGIYVCEENEKTLPKEKLESFNAAVDEYHAAIAGPVQ
jgi:carbamate kinase